MKNKIIILYLFLFAPFYANIYSQTLDFISISVGNYMEGAFSDIP